VAFAESVIHECARFAGGRYEVPAAELTERPVVRFARDQRKTLVLADLTGSALKALGLNNDISASADYTTSQAWAQAIHGANPGKVISPSQFMRQIRPELYSDSTSRVKHQLKAEILSHHLDTIAERNQTHDFELFCRKLCERTICPNLRPATGPEGDVPFAVEP
jgi:hypothetical protein